jgi:autotransporter-associated beta strand protein
MKYFFTFLFLSFNFVFFSQNIKISEQHSKNQNDNFYLNKDVNQAILCAYEDIEVSSKLIEKYLDQGFEVILKTKKNIEISAPIFYERNQKGILKFISEDTGTIQMTNLAKIVSTKSRLDFIIKTQGNIKINPSTHIQTNGGDIQLKAFKQTQKIKRYATSSTVIDGTLDASAIYGGKITIESDDINIGATARVLSTGANGGGKILIGGDWQGGTIQNKRESDAIYESIGVHVAEGALIDASAKLNGNGGKVVIWSNVDHPKSNTEVKGELLAMGGKYAGKGGMIETSGGAVDFEKVKVSTIASDGSAGEWLIDPWNFFFNSTQLATLASNLGGANITISTGSNSASGGPTTFFGRGYIVFDASLTYTNSNARTLTLSSNADIWIKGNITSSGGALSLSFNAPSDRRIYLNGDVSTNGGTISVNNSSQINFQKITGTQTIASNGGAINFSNSNIRLLRHSGTLSINSGSGQLGLGGSGSVEQVNTFFDISSPNTLVTWGGAHTLWDNVNGGTNSGLRSYGSNNIVSGREYALKLWFWDSWDGGEGGEVIVRESNNTVQYYFRGFRTHNSGFTSHDGFSRSTYQINSESNQGRNNWNDQNVEIYFQAQHNGTLQTYTNLGSDQNDESLEVQDLIEISFPTTTYSSGSRSLELISNSGQLACGSKNFSELANITFNTNNNNGFVDGIISGTTNVIKSGTGRVRFSGRNTYSGTTTVSAGTYAFAPLFTTDVALSGAFTNNANVTYETGNVNSRPTIYLDGGISGSGTWNISSDVAPASIWNNRLSLRSTTNTSGQINISSHGNLWLEGSNINMTSTIFTDGTNARLRLYGPANATMSTGAITGTGTVDFSDGGGGKNLTLSINTSSTNAQFDGFFVNSGVSVGPTVLNISKNGTGAYTLTGNNTYSGTTSVNAGTLQIGNGAATGRLGSGAVTVATNSTLNFNLNTAASFSNGFTFTAAGATIANTSSTSGAMITLSGGLNAGNIGTSILDGGTAGITVSGSATPPSAGAGVWIKGDVTFTGNNLNSLVILSVGSGSTMRFKTTATPWFFGSTTAANAPNIVVDPSITVSQNTGQAAGNLFYNNLSGSGTISLAGGGATHSILGESSVSNLNATSSIALVVGQGSASGSITSGNITANNGITLNSTSSYIFSGVLAGTNLTKQNTNTVTLTGANTYTGTTTISGGTLQIGNNGTTGSIGSGSIVNNGTLSINRSDNLTLANAISGTGIVNKLNNTTATFTNNNTYSGATNITGTLVLQNNAPTSSSTTYQGAGRLQIEPTSTSFASGYTTSGWTFDSTLTGLTLGKNNNNTDVTVGSTATIAGPIMIYGGNLNINENLISTAQNANILMKASNIISLANAKNIRSNNGDILFWSSSNTSNLNSGGIIVGENAIINSANGNTSQATGGGKIILAGGADNGANNGVSDDGIPDNYIQSSSSHAIELGSSNLGSNVSFYSGGGRILIFGNSSAGNGILWRRNAIISSGQGIININGESSFGNGVDLGDINTGGASINIVSSGGNSETPAISIIGSTTSSGSSNMGLVTVSGSIQSTGTGSIYLKGKTTNSPFSYYDLGTDALASSGDITIEAEGGSFGLLYRGWLGGRPSTGVTSSSSNIKLTSDHVHTNSIITVSSSGKLTIEPFSSSFTNAQMWPSTSTISGRFTSIGISSNVSGLTIGKPSNAANLTFRSSTSIAGPVTVYSGAINLDENLSSSNGSTISLFGNVLTIASGKTIASSGSLIIAPQSASNTIGLGGATGTLSLPASYFSTNFADGFSNIQIGSNSQTGAITTNTFTLRDHMTFLTSGSLTLGGKPVLGNNNITLGTGITTINVGSPANYFQTNGSGTVIRSIANNTNLLFPVGRIAYNPISINNKTGTTDTFSVNVLDTAYLNGSSGGAISSNYVKRTWNISKNTASANAGSGVDLGFTWNADEVVGSLANPTLNHHNGSSWEIPTSGTASVSGTTLTYTGYKGTFSPFAIGGSSIFALPVELKEFKANCQNDYIQIDWTTASEIRNKAFELFKSDDAKDWKLIHTTEGQGDKATETHYSFNDLDKKTAYYRLKDIDEDGVENWSQIIFADCKNDVSGIQIYPNPASEFIKVITPFEENTTLNILSMEGKTLKSMPLVSKNNLIHIKDLANGVYIIEIKNQKQIEQIKFLKK